MSNITTYIKFIVVYILVDMIWIIGATKSHNKMIEDVQGSKLVVDPVAASMYYLMAPLAYIFIIKPLSKNKTDVIKNAMLVGLLMYGTFDLTNKALFKNYTWKYAVSDILWGMTSMAVSSSIVFSF